MDGLSGLSGLQITTSDTPEITPEQRYGGPADPRHSKRGEQAAPYSWESQMTPAGSHTVIPFESINDEEDWNGYPSLVAGTLTQDPTSERTPFTHDAGPWPADPIGDQSVRPDNIARQLETNAALHAIRSGGLRNVIDNSLVPVNDTWTEFWFVDPGSSDLETVGPQMKSGLAPGGRGGWDRVQSFARQNSYGFDSKHLHRRFATGSMPGNYMWMKPGGRPMIKSLPGPARPAIGEGSPFQGDNLGAAFAYDNGAVLQKVPYEYSAPPVPATQPAPAEQDFTTSADTYTDYYGMGAY